MEEIIEDISEGQRSQILKKTKVVIYCRKYYEKTYCESPTYSFLAEK